MIKYNLKCDNEHEFESWFSDSREFDKLNKKKLLECIYCNSKKIHIQPATGMNADSVAEYVGTCSLFLIKKISLFHEGTFKGMWPRTSINSHEINGKNLGIIGYGSVGKKVSDYCSKIGLNIIVYDKYLKKFNKKKKFQFSSLSFLLKNSDIISLHVPLTNENTNLIKLDSNILNDIMNNMISQSTDENSLAVITWRLIN